MTVWSIATISVHR